MDSNEFDTYLSLLGKFLRLSEDQRKSLTDELRDHLESRTEDLVATGISPAAAIHQALDELGDVAGLAHQFLFVSRLQRRRRIMKWSLGTAAVVGTIFCLVTFGRNERPGAPNGAPIIAQTAQKAPAPQDDPFGGPPSDTGKNAKPSQKMGENEISSSTPDDLSERLERTLSEPTAFDFQGVSLEDLVEFIQTKHRCEVQIDKKALTEAQFAIDTRFDKRINNVRLRTALELLLSDCDLGFKAYDGVLIITSEAKAKENLIRRAYPRTGIFAVIEARQVYSLITSSIAPNSWASGGGKGALNILPDRIIVSNSDGIQRELQSFWNQNTGVAPDVEMKKKFDTFTESDQMGAMMAHQKNLYASMIGYQPMLYGNSMLQPAHAPTSPSTPVEPAPEAKGQKEEKKNTAERK